MARLQRRQEKAAKKAGVRQQKQHAEPVAAVSDDADVAGIRPGPQPVPAWVRTEPRKS